jgi:transglutaminase/protease-like cytokinesis protein 3
MRFSSFRSKILLFFFSIVFSLPAFPQGKYAFTAKPVISLISPEYAKVDKHALGLSSNYRSISQLADDLAAPFSNDEEKVRAFFMWITANISYDCAAYHNGTVSVRFSGRNEQELAEKQEQWYFDYATRALKSRKAICEGYTMLFRELCRAENIPCEVVVGRVDKNQDHIRKLKSKKSFSTNHVWNKVQLNGKWYHLDATWASGYCDSRVRKFYRELNTSYYLAPLDKLYPTHAVNAAETSARNGYLK